MSALTIDLLDSELRRLETVARESGKSVQAVVHDLIEQLPEAEPEESEAFDLTQDPLYNFEGYDFEVPSDFSKNVDRYLYGDEVAA